MQSTNAWMNLMHSKQKRQRAKNQTPHVGGNPTMSKLYVLGEILPYHLNKKLIIALDERWKKYFASKNEKFQVVINDNKIMLVGPKVSTLDPITNENQPMEADYDSD
jgi:hypothetical protein